MGTLHIKGPIKVFIARENAETAAYSGTPALAHAGMVILGPASGATQPLLLIGSSTGVSIGSFGKTYDTYDAIGNPYSHDIEIRYDGAGSVDVIAIDDSTITSWDHLQLASLALDYPNGWNELNGTAGVWNPAIDNFSTMANDTRGYAVVIQQEIEHDDVGGTIAYHFWVFHNCKISASVSLNPKQATKMTFSWEDAHYVESVRKDTTGITSGTSVHSDTLDTVFT